MNIIITEEMRFRQRVVEYAIKYNNNAKAARRYHTSRQQVQRWRKKYDGTVQSLANKSRRPKFHPNQHSEEELSLIRQKYRYHGHEGYAQVYRKLKEAGYTR
ncbi:MAG: helix-turn-helix domain-containing protein, partial [Caldicoprobacterales bacterium]